ncbi:MAG: ATP-binding protein [Myxococcaceae bacterium]
MTGTPWRRQGGFGVARDVVGRAGTRGRVVLASSSAHWDQARREAQYATLAIGFSALALALLAGWLIARSVTRRLELIGEVAERVAAGQLRQPPLAPGPDDEIGRVTQAFNAMVAELNRLVQQLRDTAESEKARLEGQVAERTAQLEAGMERYRTLVDGTQAIPWEYDLSSTTAYLPPAVAARLGFSEVEVARPGFLLAIAHPDDRQRLSDLISRGVEGTRKGLPVDDRLQYRIVTPACTMEVETVFSFPSRGRKLRGLTLDVTENRRLERELRHAQRLQSVGMLAAGVAHEINTPVQFVNDSVHFVKEAFGDLFELLKRHRPLAGEESADLDYLLENVPPALEASIEGLARVSKIVRSMKVFAHPDEREMAPTDLNRAIENTCTIARNEYKYVADLGPLPLVYCYAADLNQVLLNLIVNAAQAIAGVVKDTGALGKIIVRTREERGWAVIEVEDTGGGIPAAIRDRIFDPFFTTKEVGSGIGQGLSVARSLVCDKHKGVIDFSTVEGRGTTFVIKLPLRQARPAAAA